MSSRARTWLRFDAGTALREAALLGGVSLLLAAGLWAARGSGRLPLAADAAAYRLELSAPLTSVKDGLARFAEGQHLFVDARVEPAGGEVPGAFRVRPDSFDADLEAAMAFLYPENHLVVYDDGRMQVASAVAARLRDRGYANVTILQGGFAAWREAGGAISAGEDSHGP